jgi:hypothetical protein
MSSCFPSALLLVCVAILHPQVYSRSSSSHRLNLRKRCYPGDSREEPGEQLCAQGSRVLFQVHENTGCTGDALQE